MRLLTQMSLRYFLFWQTQVTVVRTKSRTFLCTILTTPGNIIHTINPFFSIICLLVSVVLFVLVLEVYRFQQMAGQHCSEIMNYFLTH